MKFKGLDKKTHTLPLSNYEVHPSAYEFKGSNLHKTARQLIKEIYVTDILLEEVILPGCSTHLYLDFLLPLRKIAFEIQGEQHYKLVKFFHQNKNSYLKSKKRDEEKRLWCQINHIELIELIYTENIDEWKRKISFRQN